MGLPDSFIAPCLSCMNPNFTFPAITDPGLTSFVLACFLTTFAGISYVLDFIPPTPDKIANLKPPTIDLFIAPMMANMKVPASFPGISIGPVTIPGVGSPPYGRPMDGQLKLAVVMITLPFQLIVNLVTKLLELTIAVPTLSGIYAIFVSLAQDAGLSGVAVAQFGLCIAKSIFDLFTTFIPG